MLDTEQSTSLVRLTRHPQWAHRACARTDLLGDPVHDPELWHSERAADKDRAADICRASCPLLEACLSHALGGVGWWESDGVWGGTTAQERDSMRNAATKLRSRAAQRASTAPPTPAPVWQLTDTQQRAIATLRTAGDYRQAAVALGVPYANQRWVYAQIALKLGRYLDDLAPGQLLAAVDEAAASGGQPGPARSQGRDDLVPAA